MDKNKIIRELKIFKRKLKKEGFIIVGLFGSFARGEAKKDSDIDIVYDIDSKFLKNFSGFRAVSKVLDISKELSKKLNNNQ